MSFGNVVDTIVKDWAGLDLEKLGDTTFGIMVQNNPEIKAIFGGDAHPGVAQQGLKSQAATFVGFMSYAMTWLKKKDFIVLEQKMVELGQRHVNYGVNVSHFVSFQEAMFTALREQLGTKFEDNKYAWTFTWLNFVFGPMMRGLFEAGTMSREEAIDVVTQSFREIQGSRQFADKLFDHLFAMEPGTRELFAQKNLIQHKTKFVGFIGQGLQMLKQPDSGKAELRRLATMHKAMGVSAMHFVFFEEAMVEALRVVLGSRFSNDLATAWTYVVHIELIKPQLMAPFDDIEDIFASFNSHHTGLLTFEEWAEALQSSGVPLAHAEAGFAVLDPTNTGHVKLSTFKQALVNQQMEHPDLDHKQHLSLFCQDCFHDAYGLMPVRDMMKLVVDQWATCDYEVLGESVFSMLLNNPSIAQLFSGKQMKKQAAMFVGFMQYAINWLKQDDLVSLEANLHKLGERHVNYGLDISHLATFQEAFFASLREQLGSAFETNKYAWTFTVLHFIMGPMMRGLFEQSNVSRDAAISLAVRSFEDIKNEGRFAEALFEHLFKLEPSAQQLFRDKDLMAHKEKFVGFIGQGLQMLTSSDGGRQEFRHLAQMHNAMGVTAMHFVFFEEAFLTSLRELYQEAFTAELASAWIYVLHFELIEPQLLAPFADLEDHLATVRTGDGVTMNMQDWTTVVAPLKFSQKQIQQGFQRLDVDKTGRVPLARFKKAVISMGMLDPHRTYEQNLRSLCDDDFKAAAKVEVARPTTSVKTTTAEMLTKCPYMSSSTVTTKPMAASCPYTGSKMPAVQPCVLQPSSNTRIAQASVQPRAVQPASSPKVVQVSPASWVVQNGRSTASVQAPGVVKQAKVLGGGIVGGNAY